MAIFPPFKVRFFTKVIICPSNVFCLLNDIVILFYLFYDKIYFGSNNEFALNKVAY